MCDSAPYVLPDISFVSGETQHYTFNCYSKSELPVDLTGSSCNFAIISHLNRTGAAIVSKVATISGSTGSKNIITVTLTPSDTINLDGEYIYQIQTKNGSGEIEIPGQGRMIIYGNINKTFATT